MFCYAPFKHHVSNKKYPHSSMVKAIPNDKYPQSSVVKATVYVFSAPSIEIVFREPCGSHRKSPSVTDGQASIVSWIYVRGQKQRYRDIVGRLTLVAHRHVINIVNLMLRGFTAKTVRWNLNSLVLPAPIITIVILNYYHLQWNQHFHCHGCNCAPKNSIITTWFCYRMYTELLFS